MLYQAVEYFERLGFVRPERTAAADFLLELTGPDAAHLYPPSQSGSAVPNAQALAEAWKRSPGNAASLERLKEQSPYVAIVKERGGILSRRIFSPSPGLGDLQLEACFLSHSEIVLVLECFFFFIEYLHHATSDSKRS